MRTVKFAAAGMAGLGLYLAVAQRPYAAGVLAKLAGRPAACDWRSLLATPWGMERFSSIKADWLRRVSVKADDRALGLVLVSSPAGDFWIQAAGKDMEGQHLLAYLLAEADWIESERPGDGVRAGDVVLDVGAHVGTFSARALKSGAARVVAIEIDPRNVECLRRNFSSEIASGRVSVVPEGAWSSRTELEFHVGVANSGTGSLAWEEQGASSVRLPVRTIDEMVAGLGLERVDFIKMDIEGAEREALRGATRTLRRWRPRLRLDSYHLPDDAEVLPRLILAADSRYRESCGPCAFNPNRGMQPVPYVTFYR